MKKPKIPFRLWPGSWGLRGRTREIAEAEYTLSGLELELRLIEITEDDPLQKEIKTLQAKKKHKELSDYEFDKQICVLTTEDDSVDQMVALLDVDLKHGKLDKIEHEKQVAEVRKEPWVAMPNISWDPSDPSRSFFELDYNSYWVEFLRENGYEGAGEEEVVENWLTDVCRAVASDLGEQDNTFVATAIPTNRRARRPNKQKTAYS
jgi:hypothetical protein